MRTKVLSLITISLLLSGCFYSPQTDYRAKLEANNEEIKKNMQSWMDSHKSELIRSWGAPDRYEDDGKGGEILIWEEQRLIRIANQGSSFQKVLTFSKQMYANSNGVLYYWRYEKK